jgi:hypothetical protein
MLLCESNNYIPEEVIHSWELLSFSFSIQTKEERIRRVIFCTCGFMIIIYNSSICRGSKSRVQDNFHLLVDGYTRSKQFIFRSSFWCFLGCHFVTRVLMDYLDKRLNGFTTTAHHAEGLVNPKVRANFLGYSFWIP